MLNDCYLENELEYKSLVFNAATINNETNIGPDTIPLGSANSNLRILGWLLPQGDTEEYSLTFNVPNDAFVRNRRVRVFVHLLTDNSNTPTGDRFAIRLTTLFTRPNRVVNISNITPLYSNNIPIQNSPGNYQYNHYVLEFDLNNNIRPGDFAFLSISRLTIPSSIDYVGALFLTSVEFRYTSK